ncbi:uncharacterized protein LOC127798959 [Diospyros lotus]|uniref:uncharacterized protein LOC127798959 n=1 Tax=Diospyros lotus TaxID=55363 RepID=UPI0022501CAE|nr:uncharacterized protein LOC127798959 [Diospyros lotus]XP_052188579.1 uncharacterized protein LOC127798959 [Diospyros lotus]
MAHLQANYSPNLTSRAICREISFRFNAGSDCFRVSLLNHGTVPRDRRSSKFPVLRSAASADQGVELGGGRTDEKQGDEEDQFGCLAKEHGWKVRRLAEDPDEMRMVAQVQAEAFHVPMFLFNDLFFLFFQAEVLSALLYRLRNSPPDRYACLVAEPNADSSGQLVGVVDVTVLRDDAVLEHLPGAEEYLYVSGIAVLNNFRRKKVATALLKACDVLSGLWGFEYLVLRAYENDWGALKLYGNAGYRVVSGDPPWMTTWIGRRRRVLMIKRTIND